MQKEDISKKGNNSDKHTGNKEKKSLIWVQRKEEGNKSVIFSIFVKESNNIV